MYYYLVLDLDDKQMRPSHRVTFSMGQTDASRKSPTDKLSETLSKILSRPTSASLLTVVCHGDKKKNKKEITYLVLVFGWRQIKEIFITFVYRE